MSTRSQIDAKSPTETRFSVIPGEDPAALVALTRRFYHDCQPQTVIESLLVDNIIHDAWLLRRFARIDAEMLNAGMLDGGVSNDANSPPATTVAAAFRKASESQSRLQGRINDTSRNQILAIKELERIQARRAPGRLPLTSPQPDETKAVTSKNGFVSQKPVSGIQ
jgi:hypothetical protein